MSVNLHSFATERVKDQERGVANVSATIKRWSGSLKKKKKACGR